MPPLNIIHTEASDAWGGQDIRVLNEALWFHAHGHRVHIFTPGHGQLFRRCRDAGLSCEAATFTRSRQLADFIRMVTRFRAIQPDVVCTHSSVDSWVGLTAARFCAVPATIRYRHVSTPVGNNFMNRWQYRGLCDHVVTTAETIQNSLQRNLGLPADKISSIPTGIAPPHLSSRAQARAALLERFNLPDTAHLIGQVSVLRSWKGQYVLIDAFERMAAKQPEARLLLIGGGPVMGDYSKRSRESAFASRIFLPGHQEDVWPFFRGLDVAVLASTKNEGIPQSGLQAMFAQCPFVGTNVGGIPEIVDHQHTGLLVAPGDPAALAAAITTVLRRPDLGAMMAENALRQVQSTFTLSAMGRRVESLMRRLTDTRTPAGRKENHQ
ncbi:glycosyltransferase family 4 protein [Desulfonatronum thioautotrophicum]|uniref:glycosyltransferase family 4 protein n=1 Tax=Desulfonatronum thioautotrophicum TaxID=617001 RepID=UPI00069BCAAA|nr:glycosyltransferase family 4 protein [Desulfonatronum thioautotrophicum]